jgi:hypothetical protein
MRPRFSRHGCAVAIISVSCVLTMSSGAGAQNSMGYPAHGDTQKEKIVWMIGDAGTRCEGLLKERVDPLQTIIVRGCIRGADRSEGPVRVRISGVYPDANFEDEANSSGEFSFSSIPIGHYVLLASQKEKTIAVRTIEVPSALPMLVLDVDQIKFVQCWTCQHYGRSGQ